MNITVFEDSSSLSLFPLSMLRGVFDVKIGINSPLERIISLAGKKHDLSLICRDYLKDYLEEFHNLPVNNFKIDDQIFLNGRVLVTEKLLNLVLKEKNKNVCFSFKGETVAACLNKKYVKLSFNSLKESGKLPDYNLFQKLNLKTIEIPSDENIFILKHPWDSVKFLLNGALEDDLNFIGKSKKNFPLTGKNINFINRNDIHSKTKFKDPVNFILDASSGKIAVSENVEIEPYSYIKGPVYIGSNVKIKSGSKIYGPCVIGEYSRVAGEIAESILHSFVNKQHDGFVGHSYICPFVNLGADTVTSDLKNNYSDIRMKSVDEEFSTGMKFLGSIVGDHSKTSINTMLNTGSIIGIFANLFGGGFHHKNIPSFSWNESGKNPEVYDTNKAVETAKIVMNRRGKQMTGNFEKLVRHYASVQNS